RQGSWEPIAGLGNVHDLRTERRDAHAWELLDVLGEGPCRASLYASVLQTNPETRPAPTLPTGFAGPPPEEAFIAQMATVAAEGDGVKFWRVGGGLITEDCERGKPFPPDQVVITP